MSFSFSPTTYNNVFSLDEVTGVLTVDTEDSNLNGKTITVTITGEAVESGDTEDVTFKVTFKDRC